MVLKIGLPRGADFYRIENGKFAGITAGFLSKTLYLPRNSYLVDFEELKNDIEGALENKVDFIRRLPNLQNLPPNVTTGPAYLEIQCYLMTMQPIQSHVEHQKFQDSFHCFDTLSWIFICMLTLVLIYILGLAAKNSLVSMSWKSFHTFFQGYTDIFPEWMSFKLTLATILAWFLLIKMIYLSSVHTDMIVIDVGDRIDTFEDVIKRNFSMMEAFSDTCLMMLDNAARFSKRAHRAARLIRRENAAKFYDAWYMKVTNISYLANPATAQAFQGIFCYFPLSLEARQKRKPYISRKPVITQNSISFFSSNLSPERKIGVNRYIYTYFEHGFDIYELSSGPRFTRYFRKHDPDPTCISDQPPSVSLESLSLAFLSDTLLVFYNVCFLSIIIFCLEHIYARKSLLKQKYMIHLHPKFQKWIASPLVTTILAKFFFTK